MASRKNGLHPSPIKTVGQNSSDKFRDFYLQVPESPIAVRNNTKNESLFG